MEENHISIRSSKNKLSIKILFGILIITTFLVPIFFIPSQIVSIQFVTSLIFALGVILSLVIYIISSLINGSFEFPVGSKYVIGSVALVPIIYILAGIGNGFSRMSFFGYTFDINTVGFIFLCFSYLFLVSIVFKEKNRIFYSYFAFLVSSIVLSLFLVGRLIFGAEFLSFSIFTSLTSTTVGSWNNVGIFFGICVFLSFLTLEMVRVSKFMKVLLGVALLSSLFFLSLVNFSIIWVIVSICSFLFIVYRIFNPESTSSHTSTLKSRFSKLPKYSLVVFVISLVFVFGGAKFGDSIVKTFKVGNTEVKPSFSQTLEVARQTLRDKPVFGSGPNSFVFEWLKWKPDSVVNTNLWNIDFTNGFGLIPTFLVTTGILGFLSWALFFIVYLYIGVRSIFAKFEDQFVKYLLVSSFFISLYLWVMSFVYIPSTSIFILTFFFSGLFFASVYLSGVIKIENKRFLDNPKIGFIWSLAFVSLLVGSVALSYGLFKSAESLLYFQKSSNIANSGGDIGEAEEIMLKAIKAVPADAYYRSLTEIELLKLNKVATQDTSKVKVEVIQKQFNDVLTNAIKYAKSAQNADDSNYLNWIALGRVYESISAPELKIDKAYESAQFAYLEALKRNPKNPGILLFLARLSTTHKDLAQARIYAEEATKMKSDYLDAYFLLSQIEVSDNNLNGAIRSVTSASIIDPTNPAIFFQLGLLKYNIKDFNGAINALNKAIALASDYANAKYFLGLSYEAIGERAKAIKEFEAIQVTNPDSVEVNTILANLKAGKSIFENTSTSKPEKAKTLPVKEKSQ